MKKILSMILVLTMVVTTLVGVMVIDVNAMKVTGDGGEDLSTRTWTVNMSTAGTQRVTMATGQWYVNPRAAADGETVPYYLGEIEQVSNLGKTYWHMDFNDLTYKEGDDTNCVDAAYARFRTDSTNPAAGATTAPGGGNPITTMTAAEFNATVGGATADDGTITRGGVIKYTLYAYTQDKDTTEFVASFANTSSAVGSVSLYPSKLYSENGVPHKVEIYVWSNSADQTVIGSKTAGPATESIYYYMLVDGIPSGTYNNYLESAKNAYNANGFTLLPYFTFNPGKKATYNFAGSDWYISHDGNQGYEILTRENLDEEAFVEITVPDTYTSAVADGAVLTYANKTDNISGVKTVIDNALEASVITDIGTDRVVELYERYYNSPASMFTGEETNVKLVSRTTGEEVAVADAAGTMDDYYFMVNGVYVLPEKIDNPESYVKHSKDPFTVGSEKHNTLDTRTLLEDYEINTVPEDEPAYGGLRSGFLRFTNEPRGSFYFSQGVCYYNRAGYYNTKMPGMLKLSTYEDYEFANNMTTLQFDMYAPEYTYVGTSDSLKIDFSGYRRDTSTSDKATRTSLPAIYFTTSGKSSVTIPANSVDLEGNAWNTVTIQFDATNTPTTGQLDIIVYVNGEKQLETSSTAAADKNYAETAKTYISFLEYARMYTPSYSSVGIMNDAWYIGDYTPVVTATTTNEIDSESISGVTVSVDNESNVVVYDNAEDTDYSALIAAMEANGYNAVYKKVIDSSLVNKKYDEVDGTVTISGLTTKGKAVKRWIESSLTDKWVVNNGDTDGDGINEYSIANANAITSAVDNGDGTATIVATTTLQDMTVYDGIVHRADEIINMLLEEGNTAAVTQTLVGFTSVNESGKLPRVYSLQATGTELYSLNYDQDTKVATLNYREYGGTDNIPLVMVVGAYNKSGKLLAFDISDAMAIDSANEADGVKTKTFTADFGELDLTTVYKYKVFVFNSIVTAKPLMSRYSAINAAYVESAN